MQPISALLPTQTQTAPLHVSKSNSQTPTLDGVTLAEIGAQPRPILPAKASDVVLTPEQIEAVTKPAIAAAIYEAQKKRWNTIREFQYWWDVSNPKEAAKLKFDEMKLAYMRAAAQAVAPRLYELDNGLKEILQTLALYFAEDEAFEKCGDGYSLQKGLMIIGTVGVGKTRMMELWGQINPRMRFGVLACDQVADAYASEGLDGLMKWYERRPSGICFDDLGTEMLTLKNYGNEVSPLERVLRRRHELQRTGVLESIATHVTTNLTWDGLKPYGPRLLDRLPEMFNIVTFPAQAPSRRK